MMQGCTSAIATASVVLAIAAYVPSSAPFTPAILLSFVAAFGAVATALLGFVRRATITLLVVAATVVVSPGFSRWIAFQRVDWVMLGCAVVIAIIGAVLFWDYRRGRR
jgi:hypothetical protein